jgi:hypothetical protein
MEDVSPAALLSSSSTETLSLPFRPDELEAQAVQEEVGTPTGDGQLNGAEKK